MTSTSGDPTSNQAPPYPWTASPMGQRHIGARRMRILPTMTVLAERAHHRNVQMQAHCLLCGSSPGRPNMCGPARCTPTNGTEQDNACTRGWAAGLATTRPTMGTCRLGTVGGGHRHTALCTAHKGLTAPNDTGTEFIRKVVKESQRVGLSHAKAREGQSRTRRHHGVGAAGTATTPTKGAAGGPLSGTKLDVPHARATPAAGQLRTHTPHAQAHTPHHFTIPVSKTPRQLPYGNTAFGTPRHTTPHHTTPHHTTPHHTTPHHTTPHHTTPHHTARHHTTPHHTHCPLPPGSGAVQCKCLTAYCP